MCGTAARITWNAPLRFTPSISAHSPSLISSTGAPFQMPALLTRTSSAPQRSTVSSDEHLGLLAHGDVRGGERLAARLLDRGTTSSARGRSRR